MSNKTHYIYALTDPEQTEIKYIGRTIHPKKRLTEHCTHKNSLKLWRWIQRQSGKPGMIILEECSAENGEEREHFWINAYRAAGADLLNYFGVEAKLRKNEYRRNQ